MNEQEPTKFETNGLYWRANKYRKYPTNEDIIEKIDMTEVLYEEIEKMIKKGEIVIVNVNAKMRLGKSTVAGSLGNDIFKLLIKYNMRKKNEKFEIKNIAHDQSEYAEKMRDPETTFTVIVTDEINESEETGQDTTVIKAQQDDFSNIHADRYVHRVSCSPKDITDPNADILLYITSINEEERTTHCKLYYRYWEGQIEYTQLLGYVIINVNEITHNWLDTVRPIFYEKLKKESELSKKIKEISLKEVSTKEEAEEIIKLKREIEKISNQIKEWQEKDWYIKYYMKKRKRMELITKYKISKPRILKYAPVILKVIRLFETLAEYTNLTKKEMIKNNVRIEMRKAGMPQSIVGEELSTQEVVGVVEEIKGYHQIISEMKLLQYKRNHEKIDLDIYEREMKKLETVKNQIKDNINLQIEEYENCIKLLKEYNEEI